MSTSQSQNRSRMILPSIALVVSLLALGANLLRPAYFDQKFEVEQLAQHAGGDSLMGDKSTVIGTTYDRTQFANDPIFQTAEWKAYVDFNRETNYDVEATRTNEYRDRANAIWVPEFRVKAQAIADKYDRAVSLGLLRNAENLALQEAITKSERYCGDVVIPVSFNDGSRGPVSSAVRYASQVDRDMDQAEAVTNAILPRVIEVGKTYLCK